ncbi:MAG: hypothetical protein HY821_19130 [Acidobacteria bacterium]|nr:hypothetical protein [Acidobacteriota bacterium]
MTYANPIETLIQAARRRAIMQLLFEQMSWGLAAGLGAFALLLLVGSQIFAWYWPGLILALTAAVGWWRGRRRLPAEYKVAQTVDAALGLSDLVSTAYHYAGNGVSKSPDAHFLAVVEQRARRAAEEADARAAVPLVWPRSAWVASAALGVAVVLFTVRYGVLRSFDLRAPLATVSFDTLTGAPQPGKQLAKNGQKLPDLPGISVQDPEGTGVEEKDTAIQESLKSVDVKDPNQVGQPGMGEQMSTGEKQEDQNENGEEGEGAAGKKNSPAGAEDAKRPGEGAPPQQKGQQQKENSLLDKMRDAFANMMDKLKIDSPSGETKQAANKGGQKAGEKGEKGAPQQGKPNQKGDPNDAQAGDQKADSESAQQAKSNQSGSQDAPSNQEKSGIGKQDGNKDTQLAQQQEAMGKLSELLGKRALNVQAEVMVEVKNSKNQQLRTPYVSRTGKHMEAGSDLNRDEVPLHLQDYIQRYYEQVRKTAPPQSAAAPKQ